MRLLSLGAVMVTALLASLMLNPPQGSVSVDSIMENPELKKGETMSVHGVVSNGTLDLGDSTFTLDGDAHGIDVEYGGVAVSEGMSEGKSILVTGTLSLDGQSWVLHAEEIQIGCPSKYEVAE